MSTNAPAPEAPQTAVVLSTPPEKPIQRRAGIPNRWHIASDVVHRATEGLSDFEREHIRWLQRYAAGGNHPIGAVAERLKKPNGDSYSPDTIYQVLTGRRTEQGVSVRHFAEAVAGMRRRIAETESTLSSSFVETRTTRRIFAVCRAARTKRRIAYIFGPPQCGKTSAITQYARVFNHGETQLVRMPTRGGLTNFLQEMAQQVQVPSQRRENELRRRILDCFDESVLLIVDEAHQPLMGRGESGAMTLEFIREIHDRRKCGIVIVGTEVLEHQLRSNKILRQLWLRRSPGLVLNLTNTGVTDIELAQFAEAFELPPAPEDRVRVTYVIPGADGRKAQRTHSEVPAELQHRVVRADGLGAWCKLLEDARDLPGPKMTWGKVIIAYCLAQAAEMDLADTIAPEAPKTEGGAE